MLHRLRDIVTGRTPGAKRSSQWPHLRRAHLAVNPCCAVCGGWAKVEVHHIRPFHLAPELELDPGNLITLCESWKGGVNCHLFFGHLGDFRDGVNTDVLRDAAAWRQKLVA
jgi:hypothetical protein